MDEEFLNYFKEEKVTSWDSFYINYENLSNEVQNLFTKRNGSIKKKGIEKVPKELEEKQNAIITELKNFHLFKNNPNTPNLGKDSEEINSMNEGSSISSSSSSSKDRIKSFFDSLDREIKKIYIFYSSKEKDLYQSINKKIQNKEKTKNKSCQEIIKEINSLNYLSNLCLELLAFIYLNILALKKILNSLDNYINTKKESISYKYLKKFLSKDNSDLIYILSFKILDETLLAIQGLFAEYTNILKNNEEYNL